MATIQKAAEVVASAVLSGHELTSPHSRKLKEDVYVPVTAPSTGKSAMLPMKSHPVLAQNMQGIVNYVVRAYRKLCKNDLRAHL